MEQDEELTLQLPEGYDIEPYDDPEGRRLLVLRRADGSAVAAFEFSALGPDPRRIWLMAREDARAFSEPDD